MRSSPTLNRRNALIVFHGVLADFPTRTSVRCIACRILLRADISSIHRGTCCATRGYHNAAAGRRFEWCRTVFGRRQ